MYCINCGVKLADSEKTCPLCNTPVYHPDIYIKHSPSPYPFIQDGRERMSKRGILFILTLVFILPVLVLLTIDVSLSRGVTWSGIASLGIALAYAFLVLPMWFEKPNPVVFIPIDFVLTGGYLLYIDSFFGTGWFLPLAFPICAVFGAITTAATVLFKYLRKGKLYIFGGLMFALGGACMLVELFVSLTFGINMIYWSVYPFSAFALVGAAFILMAICKPLRESLGKRLFI